ncbi:MAG: glycosyltransferase [Anaerolineales bacterium]|nr:glycosyltransferase [Anaerolineales bacterium]
MSHNHPPRRLDILILFSDTGGGHRSAAEAIIEAVQLKFGDQVTTRMVDIFKDYAPPPLNYLPELYPKMVLIPRAWGWGYYLSNGRRRSRAIIEGSWPYVRRAARDLLNQNPSDLIVSVHPIATAGAVRAMGSRHPPFITVVTDLVTTHALWYNRKCDLCLVPTPAARQRALKYGLKEEQVQVVGLPVVNRFCQPAGDKHSLRQRLGWPQGMTTVLLVGGGEGMGPFEKTALAIAQAGLPISLILVCGRNQKLKSRLENQSWPLPVKVYGFVQEMPNFMRAADILVTKAGPGTISEALNAGLPMVLNSHLPGQEDGNISYVVSEGAGLWAPEPEQTVAVLRSWLERPELLAAAASACRRLAHPDAAMKIADILGEKLHLITPRPVAE